MALAYSGDGGTTWKRPAPLEPNAQFGDTQMTSGVGADGRGWAVWDGAGSVDALEFGAADSAAPVAAALGGAATSVGKRLALRLKCFSVPCTVSATLSGAPATNAARRAHAPAAVLARGHLRITAHGFHTLRVSLTRAGRVTLGAHHGRLVATMSEVTTLGSYTETKRLAFKIKPGSGRRRTWWPEPTLISARWTLWDHGAWLACPDARVSIRPSATQTGGTMFGNKKGSRAS
ncbi:MAG TPA: hypothetical protein VHX88_08420 [Solirubrobacteraceae bacterium]|nr:hypothetical protein [Solirubrobacteraceae bacterium]